VGLIIVMKVINSRPIWYEAQKSHRAELLNCSILGQGQLLSSWCEQCVAQASAHCWDNSNPVWARQV